MMNKDLEYYLGLPYKIDIYPEEDGAGFTVLVLQVATEDGDFIPEPPPVEVEEFSGKFVLRIPKSLHLQLSKRAKFEGTSLNLLVTSLLSEGMGNWMASVQLFSDPMLRTNQYQSENRFIVLGTSFGSAQDHYTHFEQGNLDYWSNIPMFFSQSRSPAN
jgi:antitoxin HicB